MTQPITPSQMFTYNGVTSNLYYADAGQGLPRHDHSFPHLTMCLSGKTLVRKENFERVMTPQDAPISLRENEWHEIEAVEDSTVFMNMFAVQESL